MARLWRWISFGLRLVIALVLCAIPLGLFLLACFVLYPDPEMLAVYRWKNGLVSWVKEPLHPAAQLSTPGLR
jgi:hypothetical protein